LIQINAFIVGSLKAKIESKGATRRCRYSVGFDALCTFSACFAWREDRGLGRRSLLCVGTAEFAFGWRP